MAFSLSNGLAIPSRRPWYIRGERFSFLFSWPLRSPFDSLRPSSTIAPIGNLWFAYRLFRMQTESFIRPDERDARRNLNVARFIDPIAPNLLQAAAQTLAPVPPGELRQNP